MRNLGLLSLLVVPWRAHACSTLLAGRDATTSGATLLSHSNDGDGDVAGNCHIVAASSSPPSPRPVSRGTVPQVSQTYQYFTEGYAIMNEKQVALGESTCTAIYGGTSDQQLNIVDLGQLCLERSESASECIDVMGDLATTYGYYDAGESLMIIDPKEAWIFHVLPDSTGSSAIYVGQQVPPTNIASVMNAFVIRAVDLNDSGENFKYSSNLEEEASLLGWERGEAILDFSLLFSRTNETTCKYSSGRRMWTVLNRFAPSLSISPSYSTLLSANYPTSFLPDSKVNSTSFRSMMRDTFEGTEFSLSESFEANAPFSSASRWVTPQTVSNDTVCWERSISTFKSIVSFVAEARSWLPDSVGGLIHFTPHSARAGLMLPLMTGMKSVTPSLSENSLGTLGRGTSR